MENSHNAIIRNILDFEQVLLLFHIWMSPEHLKISRYKMPCLISFLPPLQNLIFQYFPSSSVMLPFTQSLKTEAL